MRYIIKILGRYAQYMYAHKIFICMYHVRMYVCMHHKNINIYARMYARAYIHKSFLIKKFFSIDFLKILIESLQSNKQKGCDVL